MQKTIKPTIHNKNPSIGNPIDNPEWFYKSLNFYYRTTLHPEGIDSMPMFEEI